MNERVIDRAARQVAADPARSFIVQAPAGSGKTGLLIQRYLRLLSVVDAPEEILAITFTRKAAGEMRERILEALQRAALDDPPADEHRQGIWRLARAALLRDRELEWGLARNPARLRIQTIDAFNAALTRQLPLLAGLGAPPAITDRAQDLYATAARNTLQAVESRDDWSDAIAALLLHLDNRVDLAEELLAGMLARRDQWLPVLFDPRAGERGALEAAIAREVWWHLRDVHAAIPAYLHADLVELAAFAADRLRESGSDSPILVCCDLPSLPDDDPQRLVVWQGLAALLLTRDGAWRRRLDKNGGFPADRKAEKARMLDLLQRLSEEPDLDARLHRLRELPLARYSDEQWRLLAALKDVLPVAVAELAQVFAERGEVDHGEIALRALHALGDDENPTDLALALDYRIGHILVDEFQDTSTSQYRLLEALTRGWAPGDGHSLFLVGDPMQSIYRFREAEVGLFLRARREGIGQIPLESLRLEVNFRSCGPLVDWVNAGFPGLLAATEDAAAGAVPFESAQAFRAEDAGGVGIHPLLGERPDAFAEAAAIADLARRRLAETPDGTVAILVQTRTRAAEILPALRRAGLSFQAVEIESLASRPVVQDLLALTRALAHDGDRTAWLAVLRAPWCGLSLHELHTLVGEDRDTPLPERLHDEAVWSGIGEAGRVRLRRVLPILQAARARRRRESLRRRVEVVWEALGGPAVAGSVAALEDAKAFLDLLEATERAGDLGDLHELDAAVGSLFARPDPEGDARLQVMTIHKSKGLEFDTVILPGLHAGKRGDDAALLQWMERPRFGAAPDLLLAPLRPAGQQEHDPLYRFIARLAAEKDAHEQGRLLYVAATRAIRRLELFGHVACKLSDAGEVEMGRPAVGTLLRRLWPVVEEAFAAAAAGWRPETREVADAQGPAPIMPLRRLPADWQLPPAGAAVEWQGVVAEVQFDEEPISYRWVGMTARLVGVVVHRYLQQIAEDGLDAWNPERIDACRPAIRAWLAALGVADEALQHAQQRAAQALQDTLRDARGRWLLGAHREAASELALATYGKGGPETHVIDRYFMDEDGTRWVIDFKTGERAGGDRDGFLRQEAERYREQLQRYAALLRLQAPGPVRAALYFPLMQAFREIDVVEG